MSKALKALEKGGLVHLERLASILRELSPPRAGDPEATP